jgi:hypothetical protein
MSFYITVDAKDVSGMLCPICQKKWVKMAGKEAAKLLATKPRKKGRRAKVEVEEVLTPGAGDSR